MSGQLVAGLAKTEHQGKVLDEANTPTMLEQKVNRLASLETTDKSASDLQRSLTPLTAFNTVRSKQRRWRYP